MNIAVMVKILPDDEDITVGGDGSLDYSIAKPVVSTYDLNAIEAAAQLAATTESHVAAYSVGPKLIDDSKTKKNILSRGVDELHLASDAAFEEADSYQTAHALVALMEKTGEADLIICGDGSADLYARQVDVQLAEALGWPIVNGVVSIEADGDGLIVRRVLESETETVGIDLPAVVSVAPDIAVPRIAGMKDILAAGKKPMDVCTGADLGGVAEGSVEILEIKAPAPTPRKHEIFDAANEGDLDRFVAALTSEL